MSVGILDKPALGPCRVNLRPYQHEAIDAVRDEFRAGKKSTLLILPTGLGKTITFGYIARMTIERGGRVLILAHRKELIEQAADKLDLLGVEPGIEMANQHARAIFEPDAVVASVQTLQRDRLASWPSDYFRLIVTDEAHHAVSESYRAIYRHFRGAYHLGVTATADRADDEDLGQVFQSIAYEMTLWEGMTAAEPGPYLSRLRFVQCDLQINLSDLRPRQGDFSESDLEDRIRPLAEPLANAIRQEVGARPTLVFAPGVKSAQAVATALQSLGLAFDWSSGDDPERRDKVDRLHSGELQGLVNCGLFTEGFDCPRIAAVVLARPTKSRALMSQMVGRGTRLAENKADCLIVDFDYLTVKHDLVHPVELFDTTGTDSEVLQIARESLKASPGGDLVEAIEEAEQEHRQRQVMRVQARERQVRYRRVSYDPLAAHDTLGLPWRGSRDKPIHGPTQGQIQYLENLGVQGAADISKARASTLIDYLADRRKRGLATLKQVSWCIAKGCDPAEARAMTIQEASAYLEQAFNRAG